jgi:hypothetical protein
MKSEHPGVLIVFLVPWNFSITMLYAAALRNSENVPTVSSTIRHMNPY